MYILDTNAFYNIATDTFSQHVARLCEKGSDGSLELRFSPITIIELESRLAREPERFEQFKKSAQILLRAKAQSLPDPEQRMNEILLDSHVAPDSYKVWDEHLKTIARAQDIDELRGGYDDHITGTKRAIVIEETCRSREEYEEDFVDEMHKLAVRFNPRYEKQCLRSKPARLTKEECAALKTFLVSEEWLNEFRDMLGERGKAPVPTDPGRRGVFDDKTAYFRRGYEWVIQRLFCDGRHVSRKHKNDYNDMHLLLHVNDFTGDTIVTSDAKKSVLADVGKAKVITLATFAAQNLA